MMPGGRPTGRRTGRGWLGRLITRRVPLERWQEALARRPDDVKAVIDVAPAGEKG
jgi:hypothetical protein